MRKSRYSDNQILGILQQNERGMSSAQFYKWRSKFGGMDALIMKRYRELEEENRIFKKYVCRQK